MVVCIDASGWSNGIYQLPDAIITGWLIFSMELALACMENYNAMKYIM